MINRNLYGSFMSILAPLVVYGLLSKNGKGRWSNYIALVLVIAAIFISQTRSAWVAGSLSFGLLAVFIGVYLPDNRGQLIRVLGAIMVSISFLS